MIISLVIHLFPVCLMYNLRQITMPYELTLPEEKRWFLQHPKDMSFFTKDELFKNVAIPIGFYLAWAVVYYFIIF